MLSSVSSSQRILCLWLQRLSTDRLMRSWHDNTRRKEAPLVVFGRRGNLDLIVAVNGTAERRGLAAGVALTQARAMHPALTAVPENQHADAGLLEALADSCQRYTPLVACTAPDGILLDITGCTHLFGSEEKLLHDLTGRIKGFGFTTRAAIASTIGAAWAAAHFASAVITPKGSERKLLASSLQSHAFNLWLAARVRAGKLHAPVHGDLMRKEDTGGLFIGGRCTTSNM